MKNKKSKHLRIKNTFKLSNNDISKFILFLRKGVYPYEYTDDCEKFNEKTLPKKNHLDLVKFSFSSWISMARSFKKD